MAEPTPAAFEIPATDEDHGRIGDLNCSIDPKRSHWSIHPDFGDLRFKIVAQVADKQRATELGLLDRYSPSGKLSFDFNAVGVYQPGGPRGQFSFSHGERNPHPSVSLHKNGFDYTCTFSGDVHLHDRWTAVIGHIVFSSARARPLPVAFYKRFEPAALDWSNYEFTALEEAIRAPAEQVRKLEIRDPRFVELPAELFRLTRLESLAVLPARVSRDSESLPLAKIDDRIAELAQLRRLVFSQTCIEEIPTAVGELKSLEHFACARARVRSLHPTVVQLPVLRSLSLAGNELQALPEGMRMPALDVLDISDNRFATISEEVLAQPALCDLRLDGNPLVSLPDAINDIAEVDLAIEDKLRLMDFEYCGADGAGTHAWDDAVYQAAADTELASVATQLLDVDGAREHREVLDLWMKKAVAFSHVEPEDYADIGNHRFGGLPDLPPSIDHPTFECEVDGAMTEYRYEFLGQVNCAEITHLQAYLPRSGMLYFFLTTLHDIGWADHPAKVLHVTDGMQMLRSGASQMSEGPGFFDIDEPGYRGFKVSARKIVSAPHLYAVDRNPYMFRGAAAHLRDDSQAVEDLSIVLEEQLETHSAHEYAINCYGFSQNEYPELEVALARKGRPQDWIILLKVSSAGDMQWSDAGDLFLLIHKSDLARRDFSNVYCTLYSS